MAKQTIKTGTQVRFLGYSDGEGDTFEKGDTLTIVGFDPDDSTYAVEDGDGARDSIYAKEFEVIEEKATKGKKAKAEAPAKKSASSKTRKVAATEEDEEEDEEDEEEEQEEAPKTRGRGKAASETPNSRKSSANVKAAKTEKAAKTAKSGKSNKSAEQEEVPLPAFKTTASVKAVLEAHKGNALAAAHDLAESSEKTVFTLGGVLAYIKRNNLHESLLSDEKDEETGKRLPLYEKGIKGFNAYVQDSLGIAARKADYYVGLYEKFSQITTEAKIGKIGWTKLRELLPLELDKGNVDEWLDYAKESSTAEVKNAVTKSLVDAGGKVHGNRGKSTRVTYKFTVHDDQANMVAEAIDKAREVIGEEATESECFTHIIQEWLSMDYDDPDLDEEEEEGEED